MHRVLLWLSIASAGVTLTACAVKTTPATDVGSTSARLNGRGHSGWTPAYVDFQYATSESALGTPAGEQTPRRGPIAPHRSGSFSQRITGLEPGTTYFFRACGTNRFIRFDVCDSTRSFTTTVAGATVAFAPPASYPVDSPPAAVAIANLNGPGSRDIVTANPATNDVSVLLNHGDGTFAPAVNYATDKGPLAIAVGDFTGHGRRDVVTANSAGDISVLLGNGRGGLAPAVNYQLPGVPQSLAIGDFTGDGHQDIAVFENLPRNTNDPNDIFGDTPPGVVSVFPGRGDGTFGAPINTTVIPAQPCGPHGVCPTLTDMTLAAGALQSNSSRLDLVLGGTLAAFDGLLQLTEDSAYETVLTGNGDGTFTVKLVTNLPPGPPTLGPPNNLISGLALGDLNGDGIPDIAYIRSDLVITQTSSGFSATLPTEIEFAKGNGDGTFAAPTVAASLPQPSALPMTDSVLIAAITSAARQDVVSATPDQLAVTPGNGDGIFGTPVVVGGPTRAVAAADVTHDGKTDLVDVPYGQAEVQVLANATPGG